MITVAAAIFGSIFISKDVIVTADLVAFLLYINNLIEPVKSLLTLQNSFKRE